MFTGATEITSVHVHVWDFYNKGNREDGYEDWKDQMQDPGAVQMGHHANFMMSCPHSGRVSLHLEHPCYLPNNSVSFLCSRPSILLTKQHANGIQHYGDVTNIQANVCNNCGICPYANRKPRSAFNWVMRWHRSWCPAWTAHSKVYGMKSLSE